MNNIIKVENLSKKYSTYKRGSGFKESIKSFFHRETIYVDAVKDVNFTVEEGDIVGILGPNGAGKSTTIKMLTGTLYPSDGNIEVMGYVPWKNRTAYVKHMGAVFGQKSQLIFDIPPVDSFRMNKAIYEIPDDEYNKRLNMLVELLELEDKVMRPTRVLSLGERMKCEFIMAMLHNPKIVFLDEPTIGLDVIAKHNIREFIKDMNQKGTTFILTTHDLEDVEQLARKVVIINKGEKVFDNSIQDLRRTLGNKKIVELTITKKLGLKKNGEEYLLGIEGTKIIEGGKDLTMKIEVDIDTIPISQFISRLCELCEFSDISIKELPMEKIITNIYRNDTV
jgi:ABC-2 type transport system ATP-binding protein